MLGEDAIRSFSYLVEGYTSRSLTFETDSYRAFGGLVQILDELTGARFWHGIPVPDFNRRLFWVNQEESTLKSGEKFPSWSWLAWTGSISMIPCGPLKQVAKVISYCLCIDSSGRKHLVPVSNDLHIQYRYDTIKANDIAIHSWSKLRVGFHIVFWAMSAILIVVNGGYGIRHTVPEHNPTEDEHGRHGHVVAASGGYTNGAHEFVHIETELELDDCARHVHLLIISWQDGIARRVGAAIFDAHEWMMAMPQRKLIVMG